MMAKGPPTRGELDRSASAYDYVIANANRLCECGHIWLQHGSTLTRGWGGKCEHGGCLRQPRRDRCGRFEDTGYVFGQDDLEYRADIMGLVPRQGKAPDG